MTDMTEEKKKEFKEEQKETLEAIREKYEADVAALKAENDGLKKDVEEKNKTIKNLLNQKPQAYGNEEDEEAFVSEICKKLKYIK